ncbi:MAG: hypothetical protein IJW40_07985 [Clostridia bacterium]|nr:hypothetical protein [Clostridia bacterium]
MKKNKFLTVGLLFVWIPTAIPIVWNYISNIIVILSGDNEILVKILDVMVMTFDRVMYPSDVFSTRIMIALCTTLILIAIERLRCAVEHGEDIATETETVAEIAPESEDAPQQHETEETDNS